MIGDTYFTKFPVIPYANNSVRDISERVAILHGKVVSPDSYYPLQINPLDRSDVVADSLWNDAFKDWMLWLNNNMIDPYFDWVMNPREFEAYMLDKYGSLEFPEQKVEYYRTAWPVNDQERIPPAVYDNTIAKSWQKYFIPVYGGDGSIIYYNKARLDWRMSTNKLLQITLNTGTTFAEGNVVQFLSGPNVVGQGQVLDQEGSILTCQHIVGNNAGPLAIVDMFNTNVSDTFNTSQITQVLIPDSEFVFWEPLTTYDMEDEANTYRRFINVVDSAKSVEISARMTGLLK